MYKVMLYVKNWEIEISLTSAMRIIDGLWLYPPEETFAVNADDTNGEPFPFNVLFFQFKDIKKIIIPEVNDNERIN